MTQAPIASVAALREASILFAMLISVYILGEGTGPWRIVAAILIGSGVVALRLGWDLFKSGAWRSAILVEQCPTAQHLQSGLRVKMCEIQQTQAAFLIFMSVSAITTSNASNWGHKIEKQTEIREVPPIMPPLSPRFRGIKMDNLGHSINKKPCNCRVYGTISVIAGRIIGGA